MNVQTQEVTKEAVFDERGQTIEETSEPQAPEVEAGDAGADEAPAAAESEAPHQYRVGGKTFARQDEALAYAESLISTLETEQQIADAYRQGIRDAIPAAAAPESVTPPQPALNTEELYTDPDKYVAKLSKQIKEETLQDIERREAQRTQSDQIWREFTERHPELADFRVEVEQFAQQNLAGVQGIIATKGRPAAYDWVAIKLKSRFDAYASALKPKRKLPNEGGDASPSPKATSVTPKAPEKKPLSFHEQVAKIRKKRTQNF